jgi:hypothetical protein
MAEACEIHGVAFKNGSAVLLARVIDANGLPVTAAQITAARYSIVLLDETDPDAADPVAGHTAVPVAVAGLLRNALVKDNAWDVDDLGYNFRHEVDVSAHGAFAIAGRIYRAVFELMPYAGQVIVVRFRIHVI